MESKLEFLKLLKDHGFDTLQTAEQLLAKYGSVSWYSFQEIVKIPTKPLFEEQKESFYFYKRSPPLLTPSSYQCDFNPLGDARKNHELALDRLRKVFAKEPLEFNARNSLGHKWFFDSATFEMTSFLKDLQPLGRSKLYDDNPELWDHCLFQINLQNEKLLSALEQSQLETLEEALLLRVPLQGIVAQNIFGLAEIGFIRSHEISLWDRFRRAQVSEEIVFWKEAASCGWIQKERSFFVDHSHCVSLTLNRVKAAKGDAYSNLILNLRNPFSYEHEVIQTTLLIGENEKRLNKISQKISEFWSLELKVFDSFNV